MFDTVLFDLDGTLTDPYIGITNSVIFALEKFGIKAPPREELKRFIGPPLFDSFSEFYGMTKEEAVLAVSYYREYFADRGIFENRVYDGIESVLTELNTRGKRLIVATSKPEKFAERIIKHFNLSRYFQHVAGASMDSSRVEKSAVIGYALTKAGVCDKKSVIMVGDRKHDISGAKTNGLKSVGVLYGYGSEAELKAAGADYLAKTPQDILKVVK